jgi:hypothetical protein
MKRKTNPSREGVADESRPRVPAHLRVDDPCTHNILQDESAEVTR